MVRHALVMEDWKSIAKDLVEISEYFYDTIIKEEKYNEWLGEEYIDYVDKIKTKFKN